MEEGDNHEEGNSKFSPTIISIIIASLWFSLVSELFNLRFGFIFRKQLGCWKQRPSQLVSNVL